MPSPELSKAELERRRRAAELLGDADASTDDSDRGWGERPTPTSDDDYLRDVPPHHG
ncbi:hypothetical protein GCM10022234_08190 [Aeromicrobium panaciterrae]|uniref:hypothetical protein n=1 Tax=Aeromicrobium panaciterrae TaxID=363861 RepID=UPI0031D6AF95